jgi:hypothetical protein
MESTEAALMELISELGKLKVDLAALANRLYNLELAVAVISDGGISELSLATKNRPETDEKD